MKVSSQRAARIGFLAGLVVFAGGSPAVAQTYVQACNQIIGANGQLTCSNVLSSKAFPANLTATIVAVKATGGFVAGVHCYNPNASEIVLQFFNSVPAGATLGTTTPYLIVPIAPTATGGWVFSPLDVGFSTAISVAATTTSTGNTAPGTLPDCNVYFN